MGGVETDTAHASIEQFLKFLDGVRLGTNRANDASLGSQDIGSLDVDLGSYKMDSESQS